VKETILRILSTSGLSIDQLDAVILGTNGDVLFDRIYQEQGNSIFSTTPQLGYKHLCGEYYTSTGFALWLAANILKHQRIPPVVRFNDREPTRLQNILIFNQYRNVNHSFILLSATS